MDLGTHPYFPTLNVLSGGAPIGGKGGAAYYQEIATWIGTGSVVGWTHPATLAALGAALPVSSKTTPRDGHGLILDNHIGITEKSIFGEMYFDLSEKTKLTVGARYDEADVGQTQINDTFASLFHALPGTVDTKLVRNQRDVPGFTTSTAAPADGTAYKIAIQHDLTDGTMIYSSVSTAMKPGGINTGNNTEVLQEENVTNMEFGIKSILANGAVLLNATVFNTDIDGYQVGVVVNTGTDAANAAAEMTGFEGNLSAYMSESTRIDFNWLYTDAEFTGDAMIVDYLNPGAWTGAYGGYRAVDENGLGLMYMATGSNGVTVFKSAGFSCLTPNFNPLLGVDCPTGFEGVEQNVKGNKLPGTPELSYSLSLNKTFTSSMGTFDFRLTHRFQDSFAGDAFNTERLFNDEQKYLDLIVKYVPTNADWYLSLYAKNINDEVWKTSPGSQSNVQGGGVVWQLNDPRIYGIQFGTSF
jgi:outer membrane receptor protein involved in Fe transport